jgi:hypothetical protein
MIEDKTTLPKSFGILLTLLFIGGLIGIYNSIVNTLEGNGLNLDFQFILIPCALGIYKLSNTWRILTIVLVMLSLLLNGMGLAVIFQQSELFDWASIAWVLGSPIILIWIYLILTEDKLVLAFKESK